MGQWGKLEVLSVLEQVGALLCKLSRSGSLSLSVLVCHPCPAPDYCDIHG